MLEFELRREFVCAFTFLCQPSLPTKAYLGSEEVVASLEST